jgi:hypothetical protein
MATYLIFDVNQPLMSDYPIIEGKSNSDAIKKYCAKEYPNRKPKASGSNFVQLSAQECIIENDKPRLLGWKRKTWFELN